MATDATGAPTPLGVPKYNTSADAPSGLGFNAAMDALDALIAAKVGKPSGISIGEVPVWNGSAFVRSSITKIAGASNVDFTGAPTYTAVPVKYTSLIDVVNSAVETDILQTAGYSIPGNTLGANGDARITLAGDYLNNTGGTTTLRLKVYWGGSVVWDSGTSFAIAASATRRTFALSFLLSNLGATNVQFINGSGLLGEAGSGGTGIGSWDEITGGPLGQVVDLASNGTHAVDTTAAATVRVTATLSSAAATHELRVRKSVIETF